MFFDECDEGSYRIYAGAFEQHTGYVAAVVVIRIGGTCRRPVEVFRDVEMLDGYCWNSPREALQCALHEGLRFVRGAPAMPAC